MYRRRARRTMGPRSDVALHLPRLYDVEGIVNSPALSWRRRPITVDGLGRRAHHGNTKRRAKRRSIEPTRHRHRPAKYDGRRWERARFLGDGRARNVEREWRE